VPPRRPRVLCDESHGRRRTVGIETDAEARSLMRNHRRGARRSRRDHRCRYLPSAPMQCRCGGALYLGPVCKTMMRERLWHETRRFDRQPMGTLGATPTTSKARKGPPQCRSSPYRKRHALDRSHRITLARPPRVLRVVENGCQPLLPLAEGWGVGSCTQSSAEPKRPTRRARLGGALSGCDHS
jgi:hypothetical protein